MLEEGKVQCITGAASFVQKQLGNRNRCYWLRSTGAAGCLDALGLG